MFLFFASLLSALTIWAVVWSTYKSGANIPYIGCFGDSKESRYYLKGLMFYWPTMIIAQIFFKERYYRRGYGYLNLVLLLIILSGWSFIALYGLKTTLLAMLGWGLFGHIVMFFRYANLRVMLQSACIGLAIAFLLVGCPIIWHESLLILFVMLWLFKDNPILLRCFPLDDYPRATI